jgi:hypothetical protein
MMVVDGVVVVTVWLLDRTTTAAATFTFVLAVNNVPEKASSRDGDLTDSGQ